MKNNNKILYKVTLNRHSIMLDHTSPYYLSYPVNSIIEAKEGTLGIFTFNEKKYAFDWMHWLIGNNGKNFKHFISISMLTTFEIIELKPLTIVKNVFYISKWLDPLRVNRWYEFPDEVNSISPPLGTICVQKAKVLT